MEPLTPQPTSESGEGSVQGPEESDYEPESDEENDPINRTPSNVTMEDTPRTTQAGTYNSPHFRS